MKKCKPITLHIGDFVRTLIRLNYADKQIIRLAGALFTDSAINTNGQAHMDWYRNNLEKENENV